VGLPPLLNLANEAEYRAYYERTLVKRRIMTCDGWEIRFYPESFNHAFFTSSSRTKPTKDVFDLSRARRIDWITAVLGNLSTERYRRVMRKRIRRLFLEPSTPYVVVAEAMKPEQLKIARFVTAYVVTSEKALTKMRSNPGWQNEVVDPE